MVRVRNRGLVSGTLAFFAGFAAVALFGTTALRIGPLLHLNLVEVSWLVAIPTLTGAFLRIPFSLLVDNLGRKTILLQLLLGLLGLLGIIFTLMHLNSLSSQLIYYLLLLFGALAGTGISTFSSGVTYVSYFFPQKEQGKALGIFAGLGNTAPGIFTTLLPFALSYLGLVYSYVAWALFLSIMILIYILVSIDPPFLHFLKEGKTRKDAEALSKSMGLDIVPSHSLSRSLVKALRSPRIWALVFMYLTSFGGFEALTEWLPLYWKSFLHLTPVEAGILTGTIYSLLTAVVRIPGGWISDRINGELVSTIAYLTMIVGSLVFLFAFSLSLAVVAEIIIAVGMGMANGAVFKLVPRYSPTAVSGASGLVGGLGSAGGLLLPPIMGYVATLLNFPASFLVFTILAIISLVLSVLLLRASEAMRA
ncbi:MAG: MFS transporter [Metallosphaera sp.]|uniref:MFS transporter n=1 Tax=Metallosphaera sp. TaxID=2020860 RepID=UPI0026AD752C